MNNVEERRKIEKKNLLMLVIAILTLMTAILGATFAYFAANVVGNETASSVIIKTSNLTVSYKTSNEINVNNVGPGWSKTLNFTVSNSSSGYAGYNINWIVGTNTFSGSDLVYTLSSSSDGAVNKTQTVIPKTTGNIGHGVVAMKSTQNYTLTVKFLNRNANQDEDINKSFAGRLEVVGG